MWTATALSAGCRASDDARSSSLLERRDLQRIVELQTARDGIALDRLLSDRDATIRARAAFALGSVQDQRSAPALIEALGDDDPTVRAEAAFALGQLPLMSRAVEAALIERLAADQGVTVQGSVIEALGKVGRAAASAALAQVDPAGPAAGPAALALGRLFARGELTPTGVDTLVARLTHSDGEVRGNAAWGIANALRVGFWQDRRESVYRALDGYDRSDPAAGYVLRALAWLQDPAARGRLVEWLAASPDWRIRLSAAEALGGARTESEQAALLRALNDSSPHVRVAAATSLASAPLAETELDRVSAWLATHPDERHASGALVEALAAAGRSAPVLAWIGALPPDDPVRWRRAIGAAGRLPGDGPARVLAGASRSSVPAISGSAITALALRWEEGHRGSAGMSIVYYAAFTDALRRRDPVTAPFLVQILTDSLFRAMGSADVLATVGSLPKAEPAALLLPDWPLLKELGPRPRLVLDTERGVIVLELLADEAPVSVQTLARLAREGRLDGVPFHRVVPNFMVQGGDVTRGDGLGDPGFRLPTEVTHLRYARGTAGLARTDKDTETSQYFITTSMQPHLDGGYTAFGRVVDGLDVADQILEGDRVVRARIELDATGAP